MMHYRLLGRTSYKVSVVTIGGAGPGLAPNVSEALKAFELAIKREVNSLDIAPSYGKAEIYLSSIVRRYRSRLVIFEKTLERTYEGAMRELKTSLKRLGAKYFDIYQFHAVNSKEDLEKIFSPGGALEAFLEARETGLIKYIGITGHADMRILLKALEMFDFDTVLLPVYIAAMAKPAPENDFRPVLKLAEDRDMGVIAIKSISWRRWHEGEEKIYRTWYKPLDKRELIEKAVWFTLSQRAVTTYAMTSETSFWPFILDAAEHLRILNEEEQSKIIEEFKGLGVEPLFPQ